MHNKDSVFCILGYHWFRDNFCLQSGFIITTHLVSIKHADWSKLHDMFKAHDAKTWWHKFPVEFPARVLLSWICYSSAFFMMLLFIWKADAWLKQNMYFCCVNCPACRTTFIATRFRVAVICTIIPVPHCIRVFFYFVWFVFINHIFQFYYELCTYCNILDIYLS